MFRALKDGFTRQARWKASLPSLAADSVPVTVESAGDVPDGAKSRCVIHPLLMPGCAVEPGMKKRSMLAIASLAAGFVVAAVTPSHADTDVLDNLDVNDTLSTLDHTVSSDSLAAHEGAQGKNS